MKKLIRYLVTIMLLTCITTAANAASYNSNIYGKVTPTQVYTVLDKFNQLIIYYSKNHNQSTASKVKTLKLISTQGKKPEHVFVKLASLSNAVDKLSRRNQVKAMPRVRRNKATAIPAEVFLQAGHNLDALVKYLNKVEPGQNWGRFYDLNKKTGPKTPSDVYAMADLALRRLKLIL